MLRLILLSALGLALASARTTTVSVTGMDDDVRCPRLPCPLMPCAHPTPTYYPYHGKMCEGCGKCEVVGKRQLDYVCPVVRCVSPNPCPVDLSPGTFNVGGRECPGCPYCPVAPLSHKKRQLIFDMGCPSVLCAQPAPCPVAYSISTFTYRGRECSGCPYCPVPDSQQKRQLGGQRCPVLACVHQACRGATIPSTFTFNGLQCPGCPVCPNPIEEIPWSIL